MPLPSDPLTLSAGGAFVKNASSEPSAKELANDPSMCYDALMDIAKEITRFRPGTKVELTNHPYEYGEVVGSAMRNEVRRGLGKPYLQVKVLWYGSRKERFHKSNHLRIIT